MNLDNRPIVQALEKFQRQDPVSLHVPGHKHGQLSGLPSALREAMRYDVTELTGLDDLHEADGVIREAEEKLAALYDSDRSFLLVNGSTVGNLAMLYAVCNEGDVVLVQRNAHKSVFHALELTGARPVFLSPVWDAETDTPAGITLGQVEEALHRYPNAKAAVFTYPNYYGVGNEELEAIIRCCHERGTAVLVDEAHGAHFVVSPSFPASALSLGADVVVHSAHKTLPAMTMGSYLHIRSQLVDPEQVAHYLRMLQSSSPSYLVMASLDDARHYAETYSPSDFAYFRTVREDLIALLNEVPGLQVIEAEDPLKLLVRCDEHSGYALQEALERQAVYAELADLRQVLLVMPLLKQGQAFPVKQIADMIATAVQDLQKSGGTAGRIEIVPMPDISSVVYTPQQLRQIETEWVKIAHAAGRVAAQAVIPYPPGIPLVCAGERLSEQHVQHTEQLLDAGSNFQGGIHAKDRQLKVVIEDKGISNE